MDLILPLWTAILYMIKKRGEILNRYVLMVFLTIVMIVIAVPFIIRSLLWNHILRLLKKGSYKKVLQKLQAPLMKLFFTEYALNYNILRVYLAISDNAKVKQQTKLLLNKKRSDRQSYQIASATYFYFIEQEDRAMCKQLLTILEENASVEEYKYDTMLFRILIEKKSDDIDCIKKLLQEKTDHPVKRFEQEDHTIQIGILQYLIGVQYTYQKNDAEMRVWLKKAKSNLKHTPYLKKIKQMLTNGR